MHEEENLSPPVWSIWFRMPAPDRIRDIRAPAGPGVYQVRNRTTDEFVLFGISVTLQKRMKSLMPAPYGTGRRNNTKKRDYVYEQYADLDYRYVVTSTREEAVEIEARVKEAGNHLFNT
jgi:hypothetical protein